MSTLSQLSRDITTCQRCLRLRRYCAKVGREKRRAFQEWNYWTRPVAGFGDPAAQIWIIGLAPAAHGANRTGRVFTGDRSGDFLFAALHRLSFANQPTSIQINDGLRLDNVFISAAVRCAPPANKPTPREIANCSHYLDREWELLSNVKVLLALGKIGWDAALSLARRKNATFPNGITPFAHGAMLQLSPTRWLMGSYHVSQQNTFTGKLTPAMFDGVLNQCRRVTESARRWPPATAQ